MIKQCTKVSWVFSRRGYVSLPIKIRCYLTTSLKSQLTFSSIPGDILLFKSSSPTTSKRVCRGSLIKLLLEQRVQILRYSTIASSMFCNLHNMAINAYFTLFSHFTVSPNDESWSKTGGTFKCNNKARWARNYYWSGWNRTRRKDQTHPFASPFLFICVLMFHPVRLLRA